ncbi:Carrier protein, mitochondrial [Cryomyces antarcticus]|uniref:Carrier protein, mitochondrial n=1 Tax=Cryomyces antarcticus TaxID=329879 RepID=A0ABR0M7D1_9PEZI|nr:Carrier protein, mitochondrial [Cryomyces antarcticus]KAK5284671.1 Carrier protein, mitochondrial [Cryomyces antarcticus]
MAVPGNVIYFAGYDWLRTSRLSPMNGRVSDTYAPLVAGSTARVLAALVVSPIEMFRTRMQATSSASATGVFRDTLNGLSEMVSAEGYRSLWRGLSLTLWRDVPFSAFYWWGYEYGKDGLAEMRDRRRGRHETQSTPGARRASRSRSEEKHSQVLIDSFIAGASSGAIAAFVTTPFDVGKTRQQVLRHSPDAGSSHARGVATNGVRSEDKSMPRFIWHIFKTEGTAGLFKGWAARCLKVAPACAIMISSYEIGKKMAGGMNERKDMRDQNYNQFDDL